MKYSPNANIYLIPRLSKSSYLRDYFFTIQALLSYFLYAVKFSSKNVKQSHYRPGQAQEFGAPRCSDNRHMKVVRLSALSTGRLYPQEIFLVLISIRVWVNLRAIVRPDGLCQWKILVKPSGIKPSTFRLVAQCHKQLRHCVPNFSCVQYNSTIVKNII
jgi:hypothetical protein